MRSTASVDMPLRSRLFLAGAAVLYAPWLFLGYGTDNDIWSLQERMGRTEP